MKEIGFTGTINNKRITQTYGTRARTAAEVMKIIEIDNIGSNLIQEATKSQRIDMV